MKSPKNEHLVQPMTVEAASDYARRIHGFLEAGTRDPEELDFSYDAFERRYGLGRWTIEHLRKGRAKGCDIGVFARMRAAYLDLCEKQVTKLQNEIAIERAVSDDSLDDLEAEAAALASKIAAKKAGLRLARSNGGGQ